MIYCSKQENSNCGLSQLEVPGQLSHWGMPATGWTVLSGHMLGQLGQRVHTPNSLKRTKWLERVHQKTKPFWTIFRK